jgi:hypothetical protein
LNRRRWQNAHTKLENTAIELNNRAHVRCTQELLKKLQPPRRLRLI